MNNNIPFAHHISKRYGNVKRARGCYLYTEKNARLTDMFQENGRAILGWNTGKARTVFKNTFERGMNGNYQTKFEKALYGAVQKCMPEYTHFRIYATKEKLISAFSRYFNLWTPLPICEHPATHLEMNQNKKFDSLTLEDWFRVYGITLWRPWLDEVWYNLKNKPHELFLNTQAQTNEVTAIIPPFPWGNDCYIAAFGTKYENRILDSDTLPPPILAAYTRSFYDLLDEMPKRYEQTWNMFDSALSPYWTRRGPYLLPRISRKKYDDFFIHCLNNKLIISPDYDVPSIIPHGANSGDFSYLQKNPFNAETT